MPIDLMLDYHIAQGAKCLDKIKDFENRVAASTRESYEQYTQEEREILVGLYREAGHAFFDAADTTAVISLFKRIILHLDIEDMRILLKCLIRRAEFDPALQCLQAMMHIKGFNPKDRDLLLDCGYVFLGLQNDGYLDTKYFKQSMLEQHGYYKPDYFVSDAEEMIVEFYKLNIMESGAKIFNILSAGNKTIEEILATLVVSIESMKPKFREPYIETIFRLPVLLW